MSGECQAGLTPIKNAAFVFFPVVPGVLNIAGSNRRCLVVFAFSEVSLHVSQDSRVNHPTYFDL